MLNVSAECKKILKHIGFKKIYSKLDEQAVAAFDENDVGEAVKEIDRRTGCVNIAYLFCVSENEDILKLGDKAIGLAISEYLYLQREVSNVGIRVYRRQSGKEQQIAVKLSFTLLM